MIGAGLLLAGLPGFVDRFTGKVTLKRDPTKDRPRRIIGKIALQRDCTGGAVSRLTRHASSARKPCFQSSCSLRDD
jgi:hypothetical protein